MGLNLVLTLDTRLQQAAYSILRGEIDFWNNYLGRINATSGVVIAMNPKTGEILAMVNWPTFENNRMARFIPSYYYQQLIEDATEPLLNHAVGPFQRADGLISIDRIADFDRSSDGFRMDRFELLKPTFEIAIERIRAFCLDNCQARHTIN